MHPEPERKAAGTTFRPAPSAVSPARCGVVHNTRCRAERATWMQRTLPVTLVACLLLTPVSTRAQATRSRVAQVTLIVVKRPPATAPISAPEPRLPTGETVRRVGPQVLDVTAPIPFVVRTGDVLGLTKGQCSRGDNVTRLFVRDSAGRLVIVPEAAGASPVMLSATAERVVRYRVIAEPGQATGAACLRYELFDVNGRLVADREDVLHLIGPVGEAR